MHKIMNNTLLYLVSLQCDINTKLRIKQCNKYLDQRIKINKLYTVVCISKALNADRRFLSLGKKERKLNINTYKSYIIEEFIHDNAKIKNIYGTYKSFRKARYSAFLKNLKNCECLESNIYAMLFQYPSKISISVMSKESSHEKLNKISNKDLCGMETYLYQYGLKDRKKYVIIRTTKDD